MKKIIMLLFCLDAYALRDPFELPIKNAVTHVKLKAIVSVGDGCCQALVECGGISYCVKTGDTVGGWLVKEINLQQITLENAQDKVVEHILLDDSAKS